MQKLRRSELPEMDDEYTNFIQLCRHSSKRWQFHLDLGIYEFMDILGIICILCLETQKQGIDSELENHHYG
jgi:hypothetical protein